MSDLVPNTRLDALATEQGVILHKSLTNYYEAPSVVHEWCPPSDLFSIVSAGIKLRRDPTISLASRPFDLNKIKTNDTAFRTLVGIINDSTVPIAERQHIEGASFKGSDNYIDACSYAEYGFVQAFKTSRIMSLLGIAPDLYKGIRLIVNEENEPILMQKSDGENSAINFRELDIEGIKYPAGSIFRMELNSDHTPKSPNKGVQLVPQKDVDRLAFIRLSLFALPLAERVKFNHPYSGNLLSLIRRLTIARMGKVAARAAAIRAFRDNLSADYNPSTQKLVKTT